MKIKDFILIAIIAIMTGIVGCVVVNKVDNAKTELLDAEETTFLEGIVSYRVVEGVKVQYDSYSEMMGRTTDTEGRPLVVGTTIGARDLDRFPKNSMVTLVTEDGIKRGPYKVLDTLPKGVGVDLIAITDPSVRIEPETCTAIVIKTVGE